MTWLGADARAADLRDEGAAPDEVLAAVRDPDDARVECPAPGAVHDHVGHVHPDLALDRRGALAAAARSLGHAASVDERLRAARAALEASDPPAPDLKPARERVADADAAVAGLRERVARLQGRVRALREADADETKEAARLRAAAADLSEAETDLIAAEQALAAARADAREAFDARERRFALEDRVANLEREARAELAREVRPAVERAVARVPGCGAGALAEAGDPAAALAVARVASLDAPVVVADGPDGRFRDASRAADWLDARVLLV